jgi:uracil-DNA glycosylase
MTEQIGVEAGGAAVTSSAATWSAALGTEKEKPYFKELLTFVDQERRANKVIYPPKKEVFTALTLTPLADVKVVIIGQDPYHGPGQAHGLCFSVKEGVPPPPSLVNIFKELAQDCGIPPRADGSLTGWAEQGVLLLNSVLTVEQGQPQSHANRGWERFTDAVVSAVNQHHTGVVFMLWGTPAQKKCLGIDFHRHHLLKAPHPSPLSAHRGFFGCRHFSKCNEFLRGSGRKPIDWAR